MKTSFTENSSKSSGVLHNHKHMTDGLHEPTEYAAMRPGCLISVGGGGRVDCFAAGYRQALLRFRSRGVIMRM